MNDTWNRQAPIARRWRLLSAGVFCWLAGHGLAPAASLPAGVTVLRSGPEGVTLEVRVPVPERRWDLPGGERLVLPGYGLTWEEGRPVLPRVMVRLAVPEGASLSVRTEILETEVLAGLVLANAPALKRLMDPERPEEPGELLLDTEKGPSDFPMPYPSGVARLEGTARLRRLPVARLELTPIRLLDRAGRVEIARRYLVHVDWEQPLTVRSAAQRAVPPVEEPADSIYPLAVANPGEVGTFLRPLGTALGTQSVSGPAPTASMTGPELRPAVPLTPQAGSTVYRLAGIEADGLIRLSYAWLQANAPDVLTRDRNRIFVAAHGIEVPIRISGGPSGTLQPGEHVEFFGEDIEDDPFDPDVWDGGDFADGRPYFLGAADGPRARIDTGISGTPFFGYPIPASFMHTVEYEQNDAFLNSIPSDNAERWYDTPAVSTSTGILQNVPLSLPGVTTGGDFSLTVRLLGVIISGNLQGLHRTRVSVNAVEVDQADWDGPIIFTHGEDQGPVTAPATLLTPSTTLAVDLPLNRPNPAGGVFTKDAAYIDRIVITYPRSFVAENDGLLFEIPNTASRLEITGLTSPDAIAYDVTTDSGGLAAPLWLEGAQVEPDGQGGYNLIFEIVPADVPGPTRRLVVAAGAGAQPTGATAQVPMANLATGGADWILIGHPSLLDLAPGSALSDLVAVRQAQGLQTQVVSIQDVYDNFTNGIVDPQAVRDFIHWTLLNWIPAPTYVVLVGDATYDYKNEYGHATSRNLIPTYMGSQAVAPVLTYYAEDNSLAAVLGPDDLPDVLLGRIPAHTLAEAEATFAKLAAYEAIAPGPAWTRRAFFMSDEEGGGFEFTMRWAIDAYFDRAENPGLPDPVGPCFAAGTCYNDPLGPGPLFSTASLQALLDRNGCAVDACENASSGAMKAWITDGINAGSAVTEFIGHGGFRSWSRLTPSFFSSSSFAADDLDLLTNAAQPTFLVNINCITGGFHADSPASTAPASDSVYSLGEEFLLDPDGGAIGVLAPSHLTFISILGAANGAIWDGLMGEVRQRTLGGINLALRLEFDTLGATTDLRSYSLLADPATRLVLPDPPPGGVPLAAPGNAVVDLTWTPAPTAVAYRIERSATGPQGTYLPLPRGNPATPAETDTAVANGQAYYYKVVAIDADGMESVPSNRNLDCPAGPGCVSAIPLNPHPPATPSGFGATDTSAGGQLGLSWAPNSEPDIDYYRVRYGTTSGVYTGEMIYQGAMISGLLGGLDNEVEVFLVIEAVNTSGLESPASGEVSAVPRRILGITPPAAILDLVLDRAGDDIELSWSRIVTDIYDRPTTVDHYRVHASSVSPYFQTDESTLLATVPDSAAPGHLHVGAAAAPGFRFYLVVSRDEEGLESPATPTFPAPIYDLAVSRPSPGTLRLAWSPITTDHVGNPLYVSHYVIYAAATPFSRSAATAMTPIRDPVLGTTVDVLETEGEYFSVLAVGARGMLSPY